MNVVLLLAGGAIATIGQWLKSIKNIPTEAVQFALCLVGFAFYFLQAGPPTHWWPLDQKWSEDAAAWVLALPGLASIIGVHPVMKTDSR